MNEFVIAFCGGSVAVCLGLTFINIKLYTEYVKDKLQDARKAGSVKESK